MQYLLSVIDDRADLATSDELATDGSNACNRKVEVRPPFL